MAAQRARTGAWMCASLLGAAALLSLAAPVVALGRHGDDAATGGRRAFGQPPGHQQRPARDVAPGHLRAHGKSATPVEPSPAPAGEVLGATPRSVSHTPSAIPRGGAQGTGTELDAAGVAAVGASDAQTTSALAPGNDSQRASALGAVLGVSAAYSPAFGDLAMPVVPDRLGATLVLLVVCSQVLAAALLSSAVPQILGAFGSPRSH